MANLRFKVNVTHTLSNFTALADSFNMATEDGLKQATEYARKRITDIYLQETRHGEHPLTIAKRNAGLDKVDIPSLIKIGADDEGDLRVGFFNLDNETMRIIYLQEFGGSLLVTEKMRKWYNAMAFVSKGWRPTHATLGPENFPQEFSPLRPSTTRFIVHPKLFLRRAFHELGQMDVLVNRLRFSLESHFRGGRIPAGTTIGSGEVGDAERRNLNDVSGFSGS